MQILESPRVQHQEERCRYLKARGFNFRKIERESETRSVNEMFLAPGGLCAACRVKLSTLTSGRPGREDETDEGDVAFFRLLLHPKNAGHSRIYRVVCTHINLHTFFSVCLFAQRMETYMHVPQPRCVCMCVPFFACVKRVSVNIYI